MNGEFPSPKCTSVTRVCDTDVVHSFRIESEEFFDHELRDLLLVSYEHGG